MNLSPLDLGIIVLAVWRVSSLLTREDGPLLIFRWIRERSGIIHDDSGIPIAWDDRNPLHCIWCVSLFVAPLCYLTWPLMPAIITILALSASVCLLDSWRTSNG